MASIIAGGGASLSVPYLSAARKSSSTFRSGWVTKKGAVGGKLQNRWFVLNRQVLSYFDRSDISIKTKPLGVIDLRKHVLDSARSLGSDFVLASRKEGGRDYFLSVDTNEDAEEWVAVLTAATGVSSPSSTAGGRWSTSSFRFSALDAGDLVDEGPEPEPMGPGDKEADGDQLAAAGAANDLAAAERQQQLRTASGHAGMGETASRQGWLVKQGQKRKSWKKRWFVLSQHQLAYYNKQPKGKANSEPLGVLDLSSHSTIEARDPSLFSFVIGSADRELVVKAGA